MQLDCMNLIETPIAVNSMLVGTRKPCSRRFARLDAVRSPFRTAEGFIIEEIIDPGETCPLVCEWVHDAYMLLTE